MRPLLVTIFWPRESASSLARLRKSSERRYFARERTQGRETLHGLEVVIEDLRGGIHHGAERIILAVEIGGEDLDHDGGIDLADFGDRPGKVPGTSVGNIVAGDGGDDDML